MEGTNSEAKFSVTSIHQSVFKTHSNPQAFSAASPSSASTSSSSSFGHCNSRLPSQSLAYVNSPADGITASASVDVSDRDLFKASNRSKALDIPFLDSFPPGYRFSPFDEELIVHYLDNKVANRPLPKNKIMEVDLYSYNPEDLAGSCSLQTSSFTDYIYIYIYIHINIYDMQILFLFCVQI